MTSPSEPIREIVERDNALTKRLVRHLAAGEIGDKGRKLRARLVRVEFHAYNPEAGVMRRLPKLTVRVYGWTPKETWMLITRAIREEQLKILKRQRAEQRAAKNEPNHQPIGS